MKHFTLALASLFLFVGTLVSSHPVHASSLIDTVKGRILLSVEESGDAWYVHPALLKRYFLGKPDDAYRVMRETGLGISEADFNHIATDTALRNRLLGRIILRVQAHGEAYYIHPLTGVAHYLGRPVDAFRIMSEQGLGITKANLALVPIASNSLTPTQSSTPASTPAQTTTSTLPGTYETKTVQTTNGSFTVHVTTIDLSQPGVQIVSDVLSSGDCNHASCALQPLANYVTDNSAFAGIHGSYYCPADYASCADKVNTFFYPFYSTRTGNWVNTQEIAWLQGAILVFDSNNTPYLFPHGPDFVSADHFRATFNTDIRALVSNTPALVYQGQSIVASQAMDDKQRNTKGLRGGIGIKGKTLYLMVAERATVPDLAAVMMSFGVDHALNLDGGGTAALSWNGQYKVGPGRQLPNAILVKKVSQ